MLEIVILKGLPASGKTTYARNFVEENTDYIRVNRDDIRTMSGKYWVPQREKYINDLEQFSVEAAIKRNYNVILDATNLNEKVRFWVDEIAARHNCNVQELFFNVPLEECITRDKNRKKPVGRAVIENMYNKYLKQ